MLKIFKKSSNQNSSKNQFTEIKQHIGNLQIELLLFVDLVLHSFSNHQLTIQLGFRLLPSLTHGKST